MVRLVGVTDPPTQQREQFPPTEPTILVSACLLGTCCNHEGRASPRPRVQALSASARLVPICPEVVGGLATPRRAAEIVGGDGAAVLAGSARVRTADGDDVTAAYTRGAAAAVELARATGATRAVLKARSPSCGSVDVYDGAFTRTLHSGAGVTAAALRAAGIDVVSDEEIQPS
ncbi:MAG: hypothetical protein QOF28_2299 [Actinomycetota bacterium]|nr:hypothetical protein [Actinomycetota bacterium]